MQTRNINPTTDTTDMLSLENPHSRVAASILRIISGLMEQGFYGIVELKFVSGNLVVLKKTETLEPEDLCRDSRGRRESTV